MGATIRPLAGTAGLVVTSNNVTLDGLHILGVQATTYNASEAGVVVRASVSAPVQNLTVRNSELGNFGYGGMYVSQVANLTVTNNYIHDGVYAGITVLSGRGGRIAGNTIKRIGVVGAAANSNNAYGILLTRGYGTLSAYPVTSNFVVDSNTVTDVPTWHALDTHAGVSITFSNNVIDRAMRGIYVTADDNDNWAKNITVTGNQVDLGGLSSSSPWAFTVVYSDTVVVSKNTSVAYPSGHWLMLYPSGVTGHATNVTVTQDNLVE